MISCLNPYCSGRWSRTDGDIRHTAMSARVLILIVVEDGLVPEEGSVRDNSICLNPYCSGRWSRTVQAAVGGNATGVS